MRFKKFIKKIFSFFNKRVFKFLLCLICLVFLIVSPSFIFNASNYEISLNEYLSLSQKEKVVLNIWHVETFEGGTNSRSKFLENQAIKFNKKNNNVFISVNTLTEEQLFLNLSQNNDADIYSFGIGAGFMISSYLNSLPENKLVREDLQEYSKIGKEILAYPYILSGYALISHENYLGESQNLQDKLISKTINKKEVLGVGFSKDSFINPSKALVENEITSLGINNYCECSTTYDAYTKFLSKKFVSLLGTARDVARLKNREQNGSIGACLYNFLPNYSDLIQYIGISKKLDSIKSNYALEFCKFLTQGDIQKQLKNYGLFSTGNQKIYDNDYMSEYENALSGKLSSINVFSNVDEINRQKELSFSLLFN